MTTASPSELARAFALIAQLQAAQAELQARVTMLERTRAPRDAADELLFNGMAARFAAVSFTAGEVLAHARRVDPDLLMLLEQADIDSPHQLGKLLLRCKGFQSGHLRLVRGLRRRTWQFVMLDM